MEVVGHTVKCPRRVEGSVFTHNAREDDTAEDGLGCIYCGSMLEPQFLEAIEAGEKLGPTDKTYKVYVSWKGRIKFYFQHLSPEGRARFIALLNEKKLNIGVPGHFYVLPFFVASRSAEVTIP